MTASDDTEVRNLIARFAEATDVGTLEDYGACLTEGSTMVIGDSVTRTGRAEIVAAMEGSRAQGLFGPASGSIHVVGGQRRRRRHADEATASTSFIFLSGPSGQKEVVGTGRYLDTLTRTTDGWRLAHRRVELISPRSPRDHHPTAEGEPMDVIYTATATATGDGRNGRTETEDGQLDPRRRIPKEMGGPGGATNPEQLFAAGYAACFHSALKLVGQGR